MCILVFSFFSAEINELKDEKTRMHNVHLGSHPLSSSGWLELFLAGWSFFLEGWSLFLAGWSLLPADWSPFMAGWSLFLAGWSFCHAGWSLS